MDEIETRAHACDGGERGAPRRRRTRVGIGSLARRGAFLGAFAAWFEPLEGADRVRRGVRLLAAAPGESAHQAAFGRLDETGSRLWGWGRRSHAEPDGSRLSRAWQRGALVHWAATNGRGLRSRARWARLGWPQRSKRGRARPSGEEPGPTLVLDARRAHQGGESAPATALGDVASTGTHDTERNPASARNASGVVATEIAEANIAGGGRSVGATALRCDRSRYS